jgi:uncharacterized protein
MASHAGFVNGRHPIDAYGNGGFRFAGMSHRGSILAVPSGIYAWTAVRPEDIATSGFDPVFADHDTIDHLLIGTGLDILALPETLRWRFRDAGIRVEPMQTGAAARTYNIVLGENRKVATALLAVD